MKKEDAWLESTVRAHVSAWCAESGWRCEYQPTHCLIWHDLGGGLLRAEWRRLNGRPLLLLSQPLCGRFASEGPWHMAWLEFVLRRNAGLANVHWCIDLFDDFTVTAARDLLTLNSQGFRQTAIELVHEHADFLSLLDQAEAAMSDPRKE